MSLLRLLGGVRAPTEPESPAGISHFSLDLWSRLPTYIREADEAGGYELRAFLALIGDQLGKWATVHSRIDPVSNAGVCALADPVQADPAWLVWLGRIVGADVSAIESTTVRRSVISSASAGWKAGTKASIDAIVQPYLTGTASVSHTHPGPFRLHLITKTSETPPDTSALMIAAIERARARPAGVIITHESASGTLADLDGTITGGAGTLADLDLVALGVGTVNDLTTWEP